MTSVNWIPIVWIAACPYIRYTFYSDVIMSTIASLITSLTILYSTLYSDADQRKHQSSASLVFVWGIHRGPVNSPHKWPVTRKMFPFDDVIMRNIIVDFINNRQLMNSTSWGDVWYVYSCFNMYDIIIIASAPCQICERAIILIRLQHIHRSPSTNMDWFQPKYG